MVFHFWSNNHSLLTLLAQKQTLILDKCIHLLQEGGEQFSFWYRHYIDIKDIPTLFCFTLCYLDATQGQYIRLCLCIAYCHCTSSRHYQGTPRANNLLSVATF